MTSICFLAAASREYAVFTNLVKDEHRALVLVEAREHRDELLGRDDVGARRRAGHDLVGSLLHEDLAPVTSPPPVGSGDFHADPVDPGADRPPRVELREPAKDDDEDLLADVVEIPLRDRMILQRPQDERREALDELARSHRRLLDTTLVEATYPRDQRLRKRRHSHVLPVPRAGSQK